jgi:sigma-E factor negative regulatory protein RseB
MSRLRGSERTYALALSSWFTLTLAMAGAAMADEPGKWLERMNEALTSRNYDGTFSHWQGGRVEMLRIIHRVQNGAVSERLVSLDGSGREFIRTGSNLACYLPDKRTVLVENRPAQESLLSGFPTINDQSATFYDIKEVAQTRLNRRPTHVITVTPKDEYRYGYRLWIDESTAMPLKTQLSDAHGHVIEQVVFANLTLASRIPDAAFKPDVSTDGFQWLRNDATPPKDAAPVDTVVWEALKLPPGFKMTVRKAQTLPGSTDPVDHLVFTDGLASVSVFVEVRAQKPKQSDSSDDDAQVDESATVGSSSAFSTVIDGHKVTAVGEVPPATVRFIANSVQAGSSSGGGAPPPVAGPRH